MPSEEGVFAVIDEISNRTAYLEPLNGGAAIEMSSSHLPIGAKEGDVLEMVGAKWSLNVEKTAERKASIKSRLDRLRKS